VGEGNGDRLQTEAATVMALLIREKAATVRLLFSPNLVRTQPIETGMAPPILDSQRVEGHGAMPFGYPVNCAAGV
jgi:hypothetical protein